MALSLANGVSGKNAGDMSPWIDLWRISARQDPLRTNEDPTFEEEEEVLGVFDKLPRLTRAYLTILFTFPLDDLANVARICRPLLAEALPLMGLRWDDEALDDAAACYGPVWLIVEADYLKSRNPAAVEQWRKTHTAVASSSTGGAGRHLAGQRDR